MNHHFVVPLALFFLCWCFVVSGTNAQYSCSCTCCSGNGCSAIYQGSVSVSSCSTSCDASCASSYPAGCAEPASGGPGIISTSCTSSSPTGSSSTVPWTGNWKANTQCDQSQCCCIAGVFTLSESGSNLVLNAPSLIGHCGATSSFTTSVPYPTTYSFNTQIAGDIDVFTLSSDGNSISQQDLTAPACSGGASRNSANRSLMKSYPIFFVLFAIAIVTLLI